MKTIFKSFKFRIYPNKNILKQGLKILSGSGIESDIKQKQVEALPLGESMKPETHQSLADV
jgi:hypothetical protein